ncbi:tetratricopeptide repeat protein [Rhodoferax ferrireducens]|uniref:tetratricopeptide repeat protein n=1 Tax=Rhodoferax ferrireducens TaxID=192843 RepID=UPI003BB5DFE1
MAIALVLTGCAAPVPTVWRVAPNYRISNSGPDRVAANGYMALARQFEGEHRWRDARDAWRKAALEAPNNADVMNALGMAEAAQGLFGNAVAALRRAVALAPQRAALLNNLGYALLLDGRTDEAKDVLREALVLNPEHRLARSNLNRVDQVALNATPLATPPKDASATSELAASTQAPQLQSVPNLEPMPLRQAGLSAVAAVTVPPIASPAVPVAEAPPTVAPTPPVTGRAREVLQPRVEIANGNGVEGMAAWLGGWMRARGLVQRTALTNARPFNTATTVVQYRVGYFGAAQAFAERMPHPVKLASEPGGALGADIRIVLGRDYRAAAPCQRRCPGYDATTLAKMGL